MKTILAIPYPIRCKLISCNKSISLLICLSVSASLVRPQLIEDMLRTLLCVGDPKADETCFLALINRSMEEKDTKIEKNLTQYGKPK